MDIKNSSQKGIAVPDANIVPVTSTSDVIDLMNLGQKNRAVCSTAMNDRSSRSHRYDSAMLPFFKQINGIFHTKQNSEQIISG